MNLYIMVKCSVYGNKIRLQRAGFIAAYQTFVNHTGDEDLEKLIEEFISSMKDENKQLEKILKVNGIGLPPAPPERPEARLEDIPPGARFYDPEISASLSMNVAAGLVACQPWVCALEKISV